MSKPKVLIIDDSALMRELLSHLITKEGSLQVVGTAADPIIAWNKIQELTPDVLTLDVEMPKMDGLTFLEKLMRAHPMPVVMVSSLTEKGFATTLRALELGAIDFVTKPKVDVTRGTARIATELVEKLKAAAAVKVRARRESPTAKGGPGPSMVTKAAPSALLKSTHQVVAIAASTGGTEAIREVLTGLPPDSPGIVIVQHMPEKFTAQFAARLDSLCRVHVKEAVAGDRIVQGTVLIAPGNQHMVVERSGAQYRVDLNSDPPVGHHRPAANILFQSCATSLGSNAIGVILTGMGADGATGLLAMRRAGARTIAQDEASCVIFGMPKEAIANGSVEHVVPLDLVASTILRLAEQPR